MAQCQSWHSYNGGGFVFLIAALITAVWVGAWQKQLTASLFILCIYSLGLWCAWILGRFHQNFKKRNMGLNSLQKIDRTNR